MTSFRAIPRICPRVRNCSLSGSKFAAQGRKISEAMRSDLNGIVTEIGNAPRKAIQSGSYEKRGPFLSTSIAPTRRCSKYTGMAIRLLLGQIGQFGDGRGFRWTTEHRTTGRPEPQGLSHQEASSEMAGRLAAFKINQKPAAAPRGKRKLILPNLQHFPAAAD